MASTSIVFGVYEEHLACLPLREPPNTFQGSPNCKSGAQAWCGVSSALVLEGLLLAVCPARPRRRHCPQLWLAVGSQPS